MDKYFRDEVNEKIGRKEKKKGKTHLESLARKVDNNRKIMPTLIVELGG